MKFQNPKGKGFGQERKDNIQKTQNQNGLEVLKSNTQSEKTKKQCVKILIKNNCPRFLFPAKLSIKHKSRIFLGHVRPQNLTFHYPSLQKLPEDMLHRNEGVNQEKETRNLTQERKRILWKLMKGDSRMRARHQTATIPIWSKVKSSRRNFSVRIKLLFLNI